MKARRRWTQNQRIKVYNKTNGRCAYCGCELNFNEMVLDHVVSLHNCGKDEIENLIASCRECNYYKAGCNPDGFRKKLKKAFHKEKVCAFVQKLKDKYGNCWNGVFYFENKSIGVVQDEKKN